MVSKTLIKRPRKREIAISWWPLQSHLWAGIAILRMTRCSRVPKLMIKPHWIWSITYKTMVKVSSVKKCSRCTSKSKVTQVKHRLKASLRHKRSGRYFSRLNPTAMTSTKWWRWNTNSLKIRKRSWRCIVLRERVQPKDFRSRMNHQNKRKEISILLSRLSHHPLHQKRVLQSCTRILPSNKWSNKETRWPPKSSIEMIKICG